jgi:Tfp pilus assembly protein PilE
MRDARGFTAIEIAVGLALVSVYAVTALPSDEPSRATLIEAEVASVFADLRARQHVHHTEHGHYVSLGATEADTYPPAPSVEPIAVRLPPRWTRSKVALGARSLRCAYVAIAGWRGTPTPIGIASGLFHFRAPANDGWFYLLAACDAGGKGVLDRYYFADHTSTTVYSTGADVASLPRPAAAPVLGR